MTLEICANSISSILAAQRAVHTASNRAAMSNVAYSHLALVL